MKKNALFYVILGITFYSSGFAVEKVTDHAQRYLDANLVIVGNVLSCSTKVITKKDSLITSGSDSGWVRHWDVSVDIYKTKVDTVVKGVFADSIIIIESKPYAGNIWKSQSLEIDEKGNPKRKCIGRVGKDYSGSADRIHNQNIDGQKYIILLQKKGTTYISTLFYGYDKDIIDYFYKGLDKEGLNYYKSKSKTKKVFG
ncbi:MAG: hypothetical protein WC614_13765 [bacterium]